MVHLTPINSGKFDEVPENAKTPEPRTNAAFPAFLQNERAGNRTPDNLIKSQLIKQLANGANTGFL